MSAIRGVAERDGVVDFKDWFHRLAFDVSQSLSGLIVDFRRDLNIPRFRCAQGWRDPLLHQSTGLLCTRRSTCISPHPSQTLTQMFCMPWLFRFLVKFPSPNSLDKARRRLLDVNTSRMTF